MTGHLTNILVFATLAVCQQSVTNSTTTASSDQRLGWVSSTGSQRSTWAIIWSCLSVFIICSWKCTHLNLPSVEESRGEWYKCYGIPFFPRLPVWRKLGRKLGFMVLVSIGPEFVVAIAANEYVYARREVKKTGYPTFTMAHGFYARMGGFVLRYSAGKLETAQNAESTSQRTKTTDEEKPPSLEIKERFLSLKDVALLEEKGLSFNLAKEDIDDHAKSDGFTKLLAVVQAGWLVIQSIARKAAGLEITQLELATMAFTACAFVTYLLWWHKPFDAERATVLDCVDRMDGDALKATINRLQYESYRSSRNARLPQLTSNRIATMMGSLDKDKIYLTLLLYISGAIFSAIHFAAWSWSFPSSTTQLLWRCFCSIALATSIAPLLLVFLWQFVLFKTVQEKNLAEFIKLWMLSPILFVSYIAYIASRLALIVLIFYCFTSMPSGAYAELDWTTYLPHFS